jgi:cell filamentation protein
VTFDPFGDFETRGYLRNVARAKDPAIVQRLQHNSFLTGIDAALAHLEGQPILAYSDVLHTHETLFEGVFPWAGEDRLTNAPGLFIRKGTVLFAHPQDIRKAVDYALQKGQDKAFMREKPGEVMGYLAHGHPFLDGNGRTIMLVHAELARRAGFRIDWSSTGKDDYLAALTAELEEPGKGSLDQYLKPFIRDDSTGSVAETIKAAPGLDGNNADAVAGSIDDPALKAQYETQELRRQPAQDSHPKEGGQ